MSKTKIEWSEMSWNPVIGCSKVSAGCLNCYAEKMAYRLWCMGSGVYGSVLDINTNKWSGEIFCRDKKTLEIPLHWRKPRRIFVCSMGDLFHEAVPFEYVEKVLRVIERCKQHTFQMLTKRPKIAYDFFGGTSGAGLSAPPLSNLWLGVSVENQKAADERIPILLQIPAAVRFVSVEPMLGPVELRCIIGDPRRRCVYDCLRGTVATEAGVIEDKVCGSIDWVIIGCESGPKRRECKLEWVRDLVEQCKAANVPVFVKQLSINGKVEHDIKKFPEWARLREYPKGGE